MTGKRHGAEPWPDPHGPRPSRRTRRTGPATESAAQSAVTHHLRSFFAGHRVRVVQPWTGRRPYDDVVRVVPNLRVAVVPPGPRFVGWVYASLGCWDATRSEHGHGLEFVLASPREDERCELLLAMVSTYHSHSDPTFRLDLGHTVPIGEPWLDDSRCDHLFVSLPYPFGRELEIAEWDNGHARLLWLIPITEAERAFKASEGVEALEARFDEVGLEYLDVARSSAV